MGIVPANATTIFIDEGEVTSRDVSHLRFLVEENFVLVDGIVAHRFEVPVDIDLLQLIDQEHCRVPQVGEVACRQLDLEPIVGPVFIRIEHG